MFHISVTVICGRTCRIDYLVLKCVRVHSLLKLYDTRLYSLGKLIQLLLNPLSLTMDAIMDVNIRSWHDHNIDVNDRSIILNLHRFMIIIKEQYLANTYTHALMSVVGQCKYDCLWLKIPVWIGRWVVRTFCENHLYQYGFEPRLVDLCNGTVMVKVTVP